MFSGVVLLVLVFGGALARGQSIKTTVAPAPRKNVTVLHYDGAYLFLARDHGDGRDPGGGTEPGLFIHSKAQGTWLRVEAVSTEGASFGRSVSEDGRVPAELAKLSVSWDHTPLADQDFVEIPLRTSGSLVFPDTVGRDGVGRRYKLSFLTASGVPSAATHLYLKIADLESAFRG